jgi:hypothetical protein
MNSLADRQHRHPLDNEKGLRSAGGFLLMAVIVGAALLLLEFNHELEIVSDPVLADLIAAQSHLKRSYGPERHLLTDARAAHRELSGALRQLAAAGQDDPARTRKIDALRARLESLENEGPAERMTSEEMDASYRKLGEEIEGMIDARLERDR